MRSIFSARKVVNAATLLLVLLALAGCSTGTQVAQQMREQRAILDSLQRASDLAAQGRGELIQSLGDLANLQAESDEALAQLNVELAQLRKTVDASEARGSSSGSSLGAEKNDAGYFYRSNTKEIYGRVEWLWLPTASRYFSSVIDTALTQNLIFASDIVRFEREGASWVRFSIERSEWTSVLEAKVLDNDKISYPGIKSSLKGVVVSLPVQLGKHNDNIEFVVVEKKKRYPQLVLGRNFLTDVALVDVSRKYIIERRPEHLSSERSARELWANTGPTAEQQ